METRHAAYSLAYKTGAIFGGHFGGKNPRLIAEEIRYFQHDFQMTDDIIRQYIIIYRSDNVQFTNFVSEKGVIKYVGRLIQCNYLF